MVSRVSFTAHVAIQSIPISYVVGALRMLQCLIGRRRHLQSRFSRPFHFKHANASRVFNPPAMAIDSLFEKPSATEWRRCPPAVVWSPWATLTLWTGTGSLKLLELPCMLPACSWPSNGAANPPFKASRSEMAAVSSSCRAVAMGAADPS